MGNAEHVVKASETDGSKGMTLGEIGQFVMACTEAGISTDAVPHVRIRFGGAIKTIEAQTP